MSVRDAWVEADTLQLDSDTFRVRCRSTFSGTRWPDFARELEEAIAGGLLDGAAHVDLAVPTVGELWTAGEFLQVIASRPNPTLRTISLGALLGEPDEARIAKAWPKVQRAFPALTHDASGCWRWATKPRLRMLQVGPVFATYSPNQVLTLEANGYGPWISLRPPPPGASEFDALAMQVAISSANVVEVGVSPLEPDDEVRVNGRVVKTHPLSMHRNGEVIRKATVRWFPVNGDVFEVGGITARYEEDQGREAYAHRETHAVMMGGKTSSTVILDVPKPPPPEEDDD